MSSNEADVARAQLMQAGVRRIRRRPVELTVASYRVYLPPLSTREAAERKRAQLAELGFREHYILDEPGKQNAISLGVFGISQNADALVRKLAGKGMDARQETLYSVQTTYWLDLEAPSDKLAALSRQPWAPPGAALRRAGCKQEPQE